MAGEPPKSLIQYFKKRHRRYPFKIKLLIPFTTHRNRSKILREDIGGDLNTPHIGEHGHKIEVHG